MSYKKSLSGINIIAFLYTIFSIISLNIHKKSFKMKVSIASDHAGYELKDKIVEYLKIKKNNIRKNAFFILTGIIK